MTVKQKVTGVMSSTCSLHEAPQCLPMPCLTAEALHAGGLFL